ncbi:MAG: DUF819 family protein [Prolixibacteraceae bacterium]|nr:DUF819 family protein [Prolixibacteraceae bacterium]
MNSIYLILFYFLVPLLILYLGHVSKTIRKIGAVVLSYISGIVLANVGIFPRATEKFRELLGAKTFLPEDQVMNFLNEGMITQSDLWLNQIHQTQDLIMSIAIPLSIPLLLFSLDLKNSVKTLRTGLFSMLIAILSLMICIFTGYLLFKDSIPEVWKIAGIMTGLYTGGTPNLAALSTALDVSPNLFILTHTYDLIIGVILLFFFITIAQKTMNYILPHFRETSPHKKPKEILKEAEFPGNLMDYLSRKTLIPLLGALGIAIVIFGIGGGLSFLVPAEYQMVTVILTITTLGLAVSMIPRINRIEKTFDLGMYFILVFSVVVASMADLSTIFQIEYLNLFLYVLIAVFGSVVIHVILSAIFRIDTDSTIITITALSMSPPFVPVVAGALKNKNIIIMGITIGVVGYAIGNYLGVIIAYFLRSI